MGPLFDIDLPLKRLYSGKVRELFDLDERTMLMVASDRISAFDFVLPTPIPDKGRILTRLSSFWFRRLEPIMPNHVVEDRLEEFPSGLSRLEILRDRSMIVRKVRKVPIECVVRGFLAGSGWKEYAESGTVCGIRLPSGLKVSDQLPEPIFTPATKEEKGVHDQNISFERMKDIVGAETAGQLRENSLEIYRQAFAYARQRGILIADTKFELGYDGDRIILIDEILTPDSSRFWEESKYRPGTVPESLDKQYIRNYLESIRWAKEPPVPSLPDSVVEGTRKRYLEIHRILTGSPL